MILSGSEIIELYLFSDTHKTIMNSFGFSANRQSMKYVPG